VSAVELLCVLYRSSISAISDKFLPERKRRH
jgi:hypothetical protein